jgi:hypothetical protein
LIFIPKVHHDWCAVIDIGHVVEHLKAFKVNWVQTVLNCFGFKFSLVVWVPQADERIGASICISRGNISALEDKNSNFARLKPPWRSFGPRIKLFVVNTRVFGTVVDRHLELNHACFVIICYFANCRVVFHCDPPESWVRINKLFDVSLPVANGDRSVHDIDKDFIHFFNALVD